MYIPVHPILYMPFTMYGVFLFLYFCKLIQAQNSQYQRYISHPVNWCKSHDNCMQNSEIIQVFTLANSTQILYSWGCVTILLGLGYLICTKLVNDQGLTLSTLSLMVKVTDLCGWGSLSREQGMYIQNLARSGRKKEKQKQLKMRGPSENKKARNFEHFGT